MTFLLDANTCILLFGGASQKLSDTVRGCDEGELMTSSIAFAEVAWGSWNGKLPPLWALDGFAREVPVLAFDHLAARIYAQLPFKRGSFDRLIAAHALAVGATLVTSNEPDFADIPGLRVENWTR